MKFKSNKIANKSVDAYISHRADAVRNEGHAGRCLLDDKHGLR